MRKTKGEENKGLLTEGKGRREENNGFMATNEGREGKMGEEGVGKGRDTGLLIRPEEERGERREWGKQGMHSY